MMMEPPPPAALEMIEPELVLELLIVALDAPAQLGEPNEVGDRRRRRERRQPILRGLRFASRPFDQQTLLRPGGGGRRPSIVLAAAALRPVATPSSPSSRRRRRPAPAS